MPCDAHAYKRAEVACPPLDVELQLVSILSETSNNAGNCASKETTARLVEINLETEDCDIICPDRKASYDLVSNAP